jgi:hypothetical protein
MAVLGSIFIPTSHFGLLGMPTFIFIEFMVPKAVIIKKEFF